VCVVWCVSCGVCRVVCVVWCVSCGVCRVVCCTAMLCDVMWCVMGYVACYHMQGTDTS